MYIIQLKLSILLPTVYVKNKNKHLMTAICQLQIMHLQKGVKSYQKYSSPAAKKYVVPKKAVVKKM